MEANKDILLDLRSLAAQGCCALQLTFCIDDSDNEVIMAGQPLWLSPERVKMVKEQLIEQRAQTTQSMKRPVLQTKGSFSEPNEGYKSSFEGLT